MLHTILTIVGLVIMSIIAIAAFSITGILTDQKRDTNTSLIFSKIDKANLYLQNLRDKVNKMPESDSIGRFMADRDKASAQLLASLEDTNSRMKALEEHLAAIDSRQKDIYILTTNGLDHMEKIHESLDNTETCAVSIWSTASWARRIMEERLRLQEAEEAAMPEELVAEADREPEQEPEQEPVDEEGLTKEQAATVAAIAGKYVTVAERYERMKQRVAEGSDWKAIATEFGYNRPRDAKRFFERKQRKEKELPQE